MEPTEEMYRRAAEIEHLARFLSGDWLSIPVQALSDLCETAAYDFSLDHENADLIHTQTISLSPAWSPDRLVDAIMLFACPFESVDLSISRLATAARYLGFSSLTPYAAAVCYFRFKSLQKEYTCQTKIKSVR